MRRDLKKINDILLIVLKNEIEGNPSMFAPENVPNEEDSASLSYYASMLIENGFLRKVPDQSDLYGFDCYRITWKGHCFLDLYNILCSTIVEGTKQDTLIANIAVCGLF